MPIVRDDIGSGLDGDWSQEGAGCVFPFTYNGIEYNTCTTAVSATDLRSLSPCKPVDPLVSIWAVE